METAAGEGANTEAGEEGRRIKDLANLLTDPQQAEVGGRGKQRATNKRREKKPPSPAGAARKTKLDPRSGMRGALLADGNLLGCCLYPGKNSRLSSFPNTIITQSTALCQAFRRFILIDFRARPRLSLLTLPLLFFCKRKTSGGSTVLPQVRFASWGYKRWNRSGN